MPQFKKWGKHIRASDKSLVFRFSAGSLLLLFVSCYDYTVEPKGNCNNGLGIG